MSISQQNSLKFRSRICYQFIRRFSNTLVQEWGKNLIFFVQLVTFKFASRRNHVLILAELIHFLSIILVHKTYDISFNLLLLLVVLNKIILYTYAWILFSLDRVMMNLKML